MVNFLTKGSLILLPLSSLRLKYILQTQDEVVCHKPNISFPVHSVLVLFKW